MHAILLALVSILVVMDMHHQWFITRHHLSITHRNLFITTSQYVAIIIMRRLWCHITITVVVIITMAIMRDIMVGVMDAAIAIGTVIVAGITSSAIV
jgi:hypothetical protein